MNEKETGSFYTPEKLIEYMVSYLRNRINPRSILEPSAGDGRFVEALKEFNVPISLVEFDKNKADALNQKYGDICKVVCSDFVKHSLNDPNTYDLIIGNPPYIAKKKVPEDQYEQSEKIASHFKLEKGVLQNLWVSFVLSSIKLLSPNGVIFFVLPFEFLQVQYAEKLRAFLETKFNTIEIITFEERVFEEIEQDVCLVYLANETQAKPYIGYTTLNNIEQAEETFNSVIMRNKPLKKWSNCILNDAETELLLKTASSFPKIRTFGEISPGIVTGANSYFVLSKNEIDALNLSENLKLSILTKGSYVPSLLLFKNSDFISMESPKKRTRLLNLATANAGTFSLQLKNYLEEGKKQKLHERYKCKKRKPWFAVPIIKTGKACFFKRFHTLPKLILNEAGVYTTDVSYNIRFNEKTDPASFVFCFYNSLTMALCEYNGRFYGGGVGELVPSEFKDICVPYSEIPKERINYLDKLFREEASYTEIIDYVDSQVLTALPDDVIKLLQQIRNRYLTRRMKLYCREDDTLGE